MDPKMDKEKNAPATLSWWLQSFGASRRRLRRAYIILCRARSRGVFTAGLSPQDSRALRPVPRTTFSGGKIRRAPQTEPCERGAAGRLIKPCRIEPQPVPPLPPVAQAISGKPSSRTRTIPLNTGGVIFLPGRHSRDEIDVFGSGQVQSQLGLEWDYRINPNMVGYEAARGAWQDENTFIASFESLAAKERRYTRLLRRNRVVASVTNYHVPSISVTAEVGSRNDFYVNFYSIIEGEMRRR